MLRSLRHWATARATDAALAAAPRLPPAALDGIGALLGTAGALLPPLRHTVAENMRALGLHTPAVEREYFAQIGAHLAGALHALRAGTGFDAGPALYAPEPSADDTNECSGGKASDELLRRAAERVELGASVDCLLRAAAAGRGVILVGPHICNYLLNLARLNAATPLTVYLRHSRDVRRRAAKQAWYAASGVGWIAAPPDAAGSLGRLGRMAAALAEGRTLFITPDLPQKPDAGMRVEFFGRGVYLPAGVGLLAERSGAPLFMLTAQRMARGTGPGSALPRQRLIVHGPCPGPPAGRGRAARQAGVAVRLQWFADLFAGFLRAHAPLWYLWGDKRWTRALRGARRFAEGGHGAA
ncbi:MAG: hypothetical protein AB1716_20640 [Planctomycetota bacterium]